MKKVKKPVWIAILIVCIAVVAGCVIFLINYMKSPVEDDLNRGDLTQTDAAEATETQAQTTAATAAPTQSPTEKKLNDYGQKTAVIPEDWSSLSFDELMKKNKDIYAWLYVPNTNVDYPVCQSSDGNDDFYLDHNIYKEYQFSGTIYSQTLNKRDFNDPVTVLYGHNMLNGSMFASLHKFEDEDFFKKNNTIFVYTKDKLLTYLIYSAYTYDDRHILYSFDMRNEKELKSYQDSTLDPHTYGGNVRKGITLDKDSKILTLSTCTNGGGETRYLVQGVLVDVKKRNAG